MTDEKNKKKILYVVENTESAQFRYRVLNVVEATQGSKWEVDWVLKDKIQTVNLDEVEMVVILRQTGKRREILDFVREAQKLKKKVLFDLDDLIFDYKDLADLMKSTGSKNMLYWLGYIYGIRRIAKKVDGFITTNDFLKKMLSRSFCKPCGVIYNSLNTMQVEMAAKLLKQKSHEGFKLGYFSGSPTHVKDLKMIEPDVLRFLNRHNDAMLLIVGYMKLSSEMEKMVRKGRVKIVGFVDYLELMCLEAEVDVNLAPLVVSNFTNSKSELKYFEAAVVETVTIASPTYAFKNAILDGKNGLLAKPGEWLWKMELLYNSPQKMKRIAERARKDALDKYYGEKFLKIVEKAYDGF